MKLHYQESGTGATTLVFLHYFGGAISTWNEVISLLQNEFHCIAVDLLGFGKSPSQEKLISADDSAIATLELIRDLQLHHYILIGHSMGGKIALNLASMQPKGLLALMLLAPSPPSPEPMTDKARQEMYDAFGNRKAVAEMITNATAKPLPESIFEIEVSNNLQVSDVGWHSWPQLGSKEVISDKMEAVHVPLSIVYGEKDKRFTKHFLQIEFEKYFSTFILTQIKDSGHLLPVEAPEETANLIRQSIR